MGAQTVAKSKQRNRRASDLGFEVSCHFVISVKSDSRIHPNHPKELLYGIDAVNPWYEQNAEQKTASKLNVLPPHHDDHSGEGQFDLRFSHGEKLMKLSQLNAYLAHTHTLASTLLERMRDSGVWCVEVSLNTWTHTGTFRVPY